MAKQRDPEKATEVERVFASNLRELRAEVGWSQRELARRARISRQTISAIENLRQAVHLGQVDRLAKAFDVPPWGMLVPVRILHNRDEGGRR